MSVAPPGGATGEVLLILDAITVVIIGHFLTVSFESFDYLQRALTGHQAAFIAIMSGRHIHILTGWYGFGKLYILCHF